MSDDIQKWSRDSLQLLQRIRKRFDKFFQNEKKQRNSVDSVSDKTQNIELSIENQWRKLNDLINKEIPNKLKNANPDTTQKLYNLRNQACRIQNFFKNKFGEEKHNEFQLIDKKGSWDKSVINSGIRNSSSSYKPATKQMEYQSIIQEQETVPNQIKRDGLDENEKNEDQGFRKLEQAYRRSTNLEIKEKEDDQRNRCWCFVLLGLLILVLAFSCFDIFLPTGLYSYVFGSLQL